MLEHYYLEDKMASVLYPHKAQVNMLTWDIDTETGMVWCNFSRLDVKYFECTSMMIQIGPTTFLSLEN